MSSPALQSTGDPSSFVLSDTLLSPLPLYLQDSNEHSNGGYPTELFDEKELDRHADLFCCLCASVCRQVVACPTECAALFCSACLTRWFVEGKSECPTCRTKLERPAFHTNSYAQKLIRGMTVTCPNQCDKAGLLIGVDERCIKDHLSQHCSRRTVQCPLGCGAELGAAEMATHHDICPRNTVLCPNRCFSTRHSGQFVCHFREPGTPCEPTSVLRRMVASHIEHECPCTLRQCALCDVSVQRCEWVVHQQSDGHQLKDAQQSIRVLSQVVARLVRRVYVADSNSAEAAGELDRLSELTAEPATPSTASSNSAALPAPARMAATNESATRRSGVEHAGTIPAAKATRAVWAAVAELRPGDMVDAINTDDEKWYYAHVVDVREGSVLIHFEGWLDTWNEWRVAGSGIAPFQTMTGAAPTSAVVGPSGLSQATRERIQQQAEAAAAELRQKAAQEEEKAALVAARTVRRVPETHAHRQCACCSVH